MQYKRFEDLPVWRDAGNLASLMFEFTALDQFRRHPGLRDQLERAAFSVSNNIAEGFERGTTNELSPSCILPEVRLERSGRCCGFSRRGAPLAITNLRFQIS